jgi:hypothetical protein
VEGYEVIACDDHKVGEVVAVEGNLLIAEGGTLRKSRHAVPMAFAHVDDDARVVRLSVTKEVVQDSPDVKGELDRGAVAEHYGLAEGYAEPETEGYGEVTPDDPARSSESEGRRSGVQPAAEQRAQIREGESEAGLRGRQIIPSDPHDP